MPERIDYILDEVRDMRREVTEGFKEQVQRLTHIETQLEPLFDNGQPGVITLLKQDVQSLKDSHNRQLGWLAGINVLFVICWHFAASKIPFLVPFIR
jgi:hypothetical protein